MPSYVVFSLCSSACFAGGMLLQKRAVAARGLRVAFRGGEWHAGLALVLAGAGLQAKALALGEVSVVKPLGMVQCVFALGLGVALLGERLARTEVLGASAVIAGGILLAGARPTLPPAHPPDAGMAVAGLAAAALVALVPLAATRRLRARPELPLALAAGILFGSGDALLKVGFEIVRGPLGALSLTSPALLATLAARPEFQLCFLANTVALLFHQLAYRSGRIALISPVSAVTSAAVPAALGTLVLGEPLGVLRAGGIALLLAGGALVAAPDTRGRAAPPHAPGRIAT